MSLPINARCPVARGLKVLGQKWTLLILREALYGTARFADFRSIGIPTEILTKRLTALVDEGLLERREYRLDGKRARDEYHLTEAGKDTITVMAAIGRWSDAHQPLEEGPDPLGEGTAPRYVQASTGQAVKLAFVDQNGMAIDKNDVTVVRAIGPESLKG